MITNGVVTPRRAWNVAKIYAAWYLGLKQPWGVPPILMFEPTNICNLECPLCLTGLDDLRRVKGVMTLDTYRKALDELAPTGMILSLYLTGEPFLNKNLVSMIKEAHERRIFVRISTNGHFLDQNIREGIIEGGLDNLILGVDGATPEVYVKFRKGGDFRKCIENIRALVDDKKRLGSSTPFIDLQFIITSENEHEIKAAHALALDLGVDSIAYKTACVYDEAQKIPKIERLSRYTGPEPFGRCKRLWWTTYLLWDGRVTPCCYDERGVHAVGSIHEEGYRSIWRGPRMSSFRDRQRQDKHSIDICKGCSMKLHNYLPTEKVLEES